MNRINHCGHLRIRFVKLKRLTHDSMRTIQELELPQTEPPRLSPRRITAPPSLPIPKCLPWPCAMYKLQTSMKTSTLRSCLKFHKNIPNLNHSLPGSLPRLISQSMMHQILTCDSCWGQWQSNANRSHQSMESINNCANVVCSRDTQTHTRTLMLLRLLHSKPFRSELGFDKEVERRRKRVTKRVAKPGLTCPILIGLIHTCATYISVSR